MGSQAAAEQVKRLLEAKLALGDMGMFTKPVKVPKFGAFADQWLQDYARVECKTSTADGYAGVLEQYLRPRFGAFPLNEIKRDDIKAMISELVSKKLSRNTIRSCLPGPSWLRETGSVTRCVYAPPVSHSARN